MRIQVKDVHEHLFNTLYRLPYPASRGYIFAVWAGVWKVASADNRSIFYRACAKFVTRFASKINRQVCHQMAGIKQMYVTTLICYERLMQDSRNSLTLSRTGRNPFFNLFVQNSCLQRLLFACQLTQRNVASANNCSTTHAEYKFIHFRANKNYNIILCTKTTLSVFVEHLGVLCEVCWPLILPER